MNNYEKIGWPDHVENIKTDEVVQEGTPLSQTNLDRMDDGIVVNREAIIAYEAQLANRAREVKVLKNSVLNNMVSNVFLKSFDTVDSVLIVTGIYDPMAWKIYV